MSYLNIGEVDAAVLNLAAQYPALTQLVTLPHQSFEGRTSHALRIGTAGGPRDTVMLIGGQHAREWGSCEILVYFAADLLEAYEANAGLAYGGKTFTAAQVEAVLEGLHVVVFPLVNPDGRRWSQEEPGEELWRRNRNPANSGGDPSCIGVDVNRNYDFLFDFTNKLDPNANVVVSDDPCNSVQIYHGPSAASEPETRNVAWLLDAFPTTRWFFDVHSAAGMILHNWGDDENQTTDPDMNFRNPDFDGVRGVEFDTAYKEYIPSGDLQIQAVAASRMQAAITAVRGKVYQVGSSFDVLYGTTGSSKDYAYSRHLVDPSKPKTFGYTIEWGDPGEFQPLWPEMELIIQDVSAGLLELCVAAPCALGLVAVTLDTPSLQFLDVPAGEEAVRAAVFTVQSCEAVTFTAQPPVETSPGPATFGLPLGAVESLPPAPDASPRQVRVWVSYQAPSPNDNSTATVTIHCDPTGEDYVIPITANTIQQPQVASVLSLDKSGSMLAASGIPGKTRNDVLHDAAPVYVDLLPDDHGIGIVAFDHDAAPLMPVTEVSAGGGGDALMHISSHEPNPAGFTAIGDAVEKAHESLTDAAGFALRASVIFTDGHETAAKYIDDVDHLIDERVFALGLGTAQELNPVALNRLVNEREGYLLLTGDLTGDDELRVEKYFAQIQAGVSNEEIVVDPAGAVRPGHVHRIPFVITEADRFAKVLLLSPAPWAIDFALETPAGDVVDAGAAASLPAIDFKTGERVHLFRMTFPVPVGAGAAHGRWHALLSVNEDVFEKYLSGKRRNRAAARHGVPYSLNVHALSGVRLRASVAQSSYEPGALLRVRALLTESGLPVAGRRHVSADLTRPDGTTKTLTLDEIEDGVFEAEVVASLPGIYPIRYRAAGTTRRGNPFTREQLRTAAVWRGGDREPPSSSDPGTGPRPGWCALAECLLSNEGVVEWLERQKVDVPELRRCLAEECGDRSPGIK